MVDAIARGGGRYAGVAMIDDSFTPPTSAGCTTPGCGAPASTSSPTSAGRPSSTSSGGSWTGSQPFGWHIVLHFDAKDLPEHAACSTACRARTSSTTWPGCRRRRALGQEPFQALLELMADERAWVKISGAERLTADGAPPYDDVVPFARALIAAAPDRVLWGTDWPHPNVRHMPDDGDLLDLLAAFAPDEATRHRILVTNPERLYDFA